MIDPAVSIRNSTVMFRARASPCQDGEDVPDCLVSRSVAGPRGAGEPAAPNMTQMASTLRLTGGASVSCTATADGVDLFIGTFTNKGSKGIYRSLTCSLSLS
eukprot:COSAG03_NODE_3748_length_1848_cov_1.436249_2_plen_101_part_01